LNHEIQGYVDRARGRHLGELSRVARLSFAGQDPRGRPDQHPEAIREWLAAEADEAKLFKITEAEVAV
jgi:hypothetical protein